MKPSSLVLNINSSDPKRLYEFYHERVGLEVDPDSGAGALWIGPDATVVFDTHSEVSGQAKDAARVLIDLHVDDIAATQGELAGRGVSFFRDKGVEWWGGVISSFEDPDGNIVQLIQYDPSRATGEPEAAVTA